MYKGLDEELLKKYRELLYSGASDFDTRLYINNQLIPQNQIENIKKSSPIIDTSNDTGKVFHIGTFISEAIDIKFKNIDGLNLESNPPIYLEIGLMVEGQYRYIPIGHFIVDELTENYYKKCEITLLDYAVRFKKNVDISQFFGEDGKITAEELLLALCSYFGVEAGTYPYTNRDKEIAMYDNTLSGKAYISYIAELMGGNAKINREGKLDIIPLIAKEYKEIQNTTGEDIQIQGRGINEWKFEGRSTQETRSGKNLLKNNLADGTVRGIQFTLNSDKTVLVNGTNDGTGNSQKYISQYTLKVPAGIYEISGCPMGGSSTTYRFVVQDNDWNLIGLDTGFGVTFQTTTEKSLNVSIIVGSGVTVSNLIFKPMIRLSGTDPSYEPYGAMPSPEFPSEIKSVTGWNKFNPELLSQVEGYNTYDSETGLWTTTAKTSYHRSILFEAVGATHSLDITKTIKVKPNTDYNIEFFDFQNNTATSAGVTIIFGTNTGQNISYIVPDTLPILSFKTPDNCEYIDICRRYTTGTLSFSSIQITEGTERKPYQPYGHYINETIQNKNLAGSLIKNECAWTNGAIRTSSAYSRTDYVKVKPNTSYFITHTINTGVGYTSWCYDRNKNPIKSVSIPGKKTDEDSIDKSGNIITTADTEYIIVNFDNSTIDITPPQIEEGTQETTYIEPQQIKITIPLQKSFKSLGEIKDTFEKREGKWYEVHKIGEVVWNGSEDVRTYTEKNTNTYYCYYIPAPANIIATQDVLNTIISDSFKEITWDNIYAKRTDTEGIALRNNKRFYIRVSQSTVEAVKTRLSTHNVTVQYILAEPEYLECTAEQVEALNKAQNITLFDGVNYIYSENEIKPPYNLVYEDEDKSSQNVEIDVTSGKKFNINSRYELERVCYDNGIQKFEFGGNVITVTELPIEGIIETAYYYNLSDMKYYRRANNEWVIYDMKNTLYIRNDNLLISSSKEVENIYNSVKGFNIDCVLMEHRGDMTLDSFDRVTFKDGDNKYHCFYDNEITFNGVSFAKINVNVPIQAKQETTNVIDPPSLEQRVRRLRTEVNETEASLKILSQDISENYATQAELTVKASEVKAEAKSETTSTIMTLLNNGYLTAEQVNTLIDGNTEDIVNIKKQLEATITDSQMQIAIQTAISGGVSYLKNTLFTIDENGMAIATDQDEFNALYNNRGMYLYSYHDMIARFDVDGATLRNLKVNGEIETNNLRIMDVNVNGVPHTYIHWIGG